MRRTSLWPLYLTVFIDLIGFSIVLPILPGLFLDSGYGLLPTDTPLVIRTQLLGIMLGLFPLLQIFSAPVLGALADRFGRKPVLVLSLCGTFVGHLLFGLGIVTHQLPTLFVGRAIAALTGGNISVATSAIADVSDEKTRAKNFGLIGMAFGLGFIIGPYLGGRLADSTVVPWFGPDTPFWFAAALTVVNIAWLGLMFRETLRAKQKTVVTLWTGLSQITKAFTIPRLRTMFLVTFLFMIGFNFFTQFYQVYVIERFAATTQQIGDLFGFAGLWLLISQGVLTRIVANRWSAERALSLAQIGSAVALLLVLVPASIPQIYLVIPFVALFNGLAVPNLTSVVSAQADSRSQGEILGMNQSVISLAQALPPILAGSLAGIDARIPLVAASVFTLLGWAVFVFVFQKEKRRAFPPSL